MVQLVIEALVLFQQLQKRRNAGEEQQVRAQNHQHHRHKEQQQGREGVLHRQGQVVPRPQQDGPQYRQHPVGLGLLFAHLPAVEQLDGVRQPHLEDVVAHGEQENGGKQHRRPLQRQGGHKEPEGHRGPQQCPQHQEHHPGEEDAQPNAHHQGQRRQHQRFPEDDVGDVPLFHTQNIVQAQLLFPALHHKAVGVEQEQHREQPNDENAQRQHRGHAGTAVHGFLVKAQGQGADGVEHQNGPRGGEQVGYRHSPVVPQIGQGQLPVKAPGTLNHETPTPFPRGQRAR